MPLQVASDQPLDARGVLESHGFTLVFAGLVKATRAPIAIGLPPRGIGTSLFERRA